MSIINDTPTMKQLRRAEHGGTPSDVRVAWLLALCWAIFAAVANRHAPGLLADLAFGFTAAVAWDRIRS